MKWYLLEALSLISNEHLKSDIMALISENEQMTVQLPSEILNLDVEKYRLKVNKVLKKVGESITKYSSDGDKTKDFLGRTSKKLILTAGILVCR